jgi:2-oxoglutarate dehydrogenase E1 component
MYHFINKHPTVINLYLKRLEKEGTLSMEEYSNISAEIESHLATEYQHSKEIPSPWDNLGDISWRNEWYDMNELRNRGEKGNISPIHDEFSTGVEIKLLEEIGAQLFQLPQGFAVHKKVEAIMNNRLRAVETGDRVDWATAEALAFGSLLVQGINVRLSGQDCERGTFNQVNSSSLTSLFVFLIQYNS